MEKVKKSLDERRANCNILMHCFLWSILPIGWIISAYKMRYKAPVYFVMLAALLLIGYADDRERHQLELENQFYQEFEGGMSLEKALAGPQISEEDKFNGFFGLSARGLGLFCVFTGMAYTAKKIRESRISLDKLSSANSKSKQS